MRRLVVFAACLAVVSGSATIAAIDAAPTDEEVSRIEAQARELTEHGARSEAVLILQRALEAYRDSPLRQRIEDDIRRFSLVGRPAPPLQTGVAIGARVPSMKDLGGKVVLVFFWAHWCADCKAESPMVAALLDRYRAKGLTVVAPTQRYGYAAGGRPASPDKELRYILQVRDASYGFMRSEAVPVGEANYKQYGVASIPTHVLIDRTGIIRLYQPGMLAAEELDRAIRQLL